MITSNLQRDDMLAHFKQMYQPSNCTLIIAGKIEQETVIDLLADTFLTMAGQIQPDPADTTTTSY